MNKRIPIIAFLCLVLVIVCQGRVITVDDDGPADFNNIQAAIDDASPNDIIFIKAGYYSPTTNGEAFPITLSPGITLQGEDTNTTTINSDDTSWKVIQTAENCVISGLSIGLNSVPGEWGEIISCSSSNVVIENNIIMDSPDTYSIYCNNANNVKIKNNNLYQYVYCSYSSSITVSNNVLTGCQVNFHTTSGNIIGNEIKFSSEGVHCYQSSPLIANNLILNCSTAISLGYYCTEIIIRNNTIFDSSSRCIDLDSEAVIKNNIFFDVAGTAVYSYSGLNSEIAYNNLWNVTTPFHNCNNTHNNLFVDPCFVDPNNGDYHLKSEGWRWDTDAIGWTWDEVTSRCIDAGNPGCPAGDEPLPHSGNRINMGAYGGTAEASIPPHNWAILGDLNNDGTVNFEDYAFQAVDWEKTEDCQPGDLNRNGSIDMNDIALLSEDWLKQTIWYE